MKTYSSIQRWIYVEGETIPDALRKLADALETDETAKEGEYINDDGVSAVTVDVDDEGAVMAGACLSYWPA